MGQPQTQTPFSPLVDDTHISANSLTHQDFATIDSPLLVKNVRDVVVACTVYGGLCCGGRTAFMSIVRARPEPRKAHQPEPQQPSETSKNYSKLHDDERLRWQSEVPSMSNAAEEWRIYAWSCYPSDGRHVPLCPQRSDPVRPFLEGGWHWIPALCCVAVSTLAKYGSICRVTWNPRVGSTTRWEARSITNRQYIQMTSAQGRPIALHRDPPSWTGYCCIVSTCFPLFGTRLLCQS